MSTKSDRQAARETVVKYHESQLAALVEHVGEAIDRFRVGELDAFEVDQVLFSTRGRRRNCGSSATWVTPSLQNIMRERPAVDWWERGAPRKR